MPGPATELLTGRMVRLAGAQGGDLGVAAVAGILVSVWSAHGGVKAIFEGVNTADDEEEKRSFLRLSLVTPAFAPGAMVLLVVLIGAGGDAEMEHQTERDRTTGPEKPMGARGRKWPIRWARWATNRVAAMCRAGLGRAGAEADHA